MIDLYHILIGLGAQILAVLRDGYECQKTEDGAPYAVFLL